LAELEAKLLGDFGAGRREAGIVDRFLDQVEDLFLPCGELEHGSVARKMAVVDMRTDCIFVQYGAARKGNLAFFLERNLIAATCNKAIEVLTLKRCYNCRLSLPTLVLTPRWAFV
jgi:hypothetical protein